MPLITGTLTLPAAVAVLLVGGALIGVFGWRLAKNVDRLADRTGVGEALAGAVLLGGATSIAGLIVSVVAAANGNASLAIGNSVGGIAAQTAFIVVADFAYRRANIEHAAASLTNLFNSFLLVVLLAIVIAAVSGPAFAIGGVHPVTVLLFVVYVAGMRMSRHVEREPMWRPTPTSETRPDEPDEDGVRASLTRLLLSFVVLAAIVAAAGFAVAWAGVSIVERTALSGTLVGAFLTAVVTSIPELVTSVAAVRTGALTLAVGGIVGGNTFDLLFIAASDLAFREGSIYAAASSADVFVLGWTTLMVAILGAGLVRRQKRGVGFEGITILVLYGAGALALASMS